ncbi:unnamed protein product [Rhodiola kirilowii]
MALRGGVAAAACAGRYRASNRINLPIYLRTRYANCPAATSSRSQIGIRFPIHAIHESVPESTTATITATQVKGDEVNSEPDWKIKMLYDGDCPLCMREVNMLKERNKGYGAIKFVDISSDDYSPEENQGLEYETVMGKIHAIMSDGTIVTNVEAFRKLYEAVGLGWVYAITKYEPATQIVSMSRSASWATYTYTTASKISRLANKMV